MARRLLAPLLVAALAAPPAASGAPGSVRVLEPGFVVSPFAETGGAPSSLAFGPDTRDGAEGVRLYVADVVGDRVLAIDAAGPAAGTVSVFADDVSGPLGVVAARDGSVFVSETEAPRTGPYGFRPYGRVLRLRDADGDGTADKRNVVLRDLPNGRHNTNGLAFGPGGDLYVTNGNSTDDGIEGGEAEVLPWSGSVVRIDPDARNVSIASLNPRRAVVASGWRNVYDLAFSPVDPTKLFVPMNGVDDARRGSTGENPADPNLEDSDDVLFVTDVDDSARDDFGFPECLFNATERGNLAPYENPNPDVIDVFGRCNKGTPRPVASFGLHTSSDGLAFQTTGAWGKDHRNDLYVAEWGSLFGAPAGHDIVRVQLDRSGTKVVQQTVFAVMDMPLDVTFDAEGVMYVADFSGTIFRIDRV